MAWSTDGGRTFEVENQVKIMFTGAGVSAPGSPRLAIARARNEVWVTYETSSVRAAGAVVNGLGVVSGFTELTVTGSAGGKHSDIAVGPDGAVAVVWQTIPAVGGTAQLLSSVDIDGLGSANFALPTTIHASATDGVLHTVAQEAAVPLVPDLPGIRAADHIADACTQLMWTWLRACPTHRALPS